MTKRRSYQQNCALAIALDILGERWTLLIIRELLLGPRRFKQLLYNLPGIGTNLLTSRLGQLVEDGVIERSTDDGVHPVYSLSARGKGLEQVVHSLIRWGMGFSERRLTTRHARSEWNILPIRAYLNPEKAAKWEGSYLLYVNDDALLLAWKDDQLVELEEDGIPAIATIRMTALTGIRIATGELELAEALAKGDVIYTGQLRDIELFFDAFDNDIRG